jgi:hypothetical protein
MKDMDKGWIAAAVARAEARSLGKMPSFGQADPGIASVGRS